jgi:PAS domain-containing protein
VTRRKDQAAEPASLRRAAERRLARETGVAPDGTPEGVVHELRVHQVELEMQNEELRRAQIALEESRDRFADLYDFAPVGYLTLVPGDLVAAANLTAATLLGVERPKLLRRRLHDFVVPEDQERWDRHCASLRLHGAPCGCDRSMRSSTFSSARSSRAAVAPTKRSASRSTR